MSDSGAALAHQFDDSEQQHESYTLGMWLFLATEIMMFGGLFLSYVRYRHAYPDLFLEVGRHTVFWIGTLNTGVLLTSSLFMAFAVHAAQKGNRKALVGYLLLTLLFGLVFMGLKGYEYYDDYEQHLVPGLNFALPEGGRHPVPGLNLAYPGVQQAAAMFFVLYFFMTGLHAIHLTIGICVVGLMAFLSWRGWFTAENYAPVEITGLFWHFIDIVWVFLYPLLYLVGRHG